MIIQDHITNDQVALEVLRTKLVRHNSGQCECTEQGGYVYPCKASEWLRGIISSKQVLEDYYEQSKNH